ncbi:MAG: hypothetical protein M3Q29_19455 [Chloroflexota bacterium]|nr:hypothetical protein [Chloroflexota bacterium]
MRQKLLPLLVLGLLLLQLSARIVHAQQVGDFTITSPQQEEKVAERSIAVRGTGTPGAQAIWDRGRLRSDIATTVDQSGRWSLNVSLQDGRNELKFRQENPDDGPLMLVVVYEPSRDEAGKDTSIGIGPFEVDLSDWVLKFLYGAWKAVGGNEIEGLGNQIAALMLTNPDVTIRDGGMVAVQDLVNGMLAVSIPLLIAIWVPSVWRFCYGRLTDPSAAITRLTLAIFLLGFYRMLFRYIIDGSNALTYGVLDAGGRPAGFADILDFGASASMPGLSALWVIVGIVGLVFVLFLGVMRLMALTYILLLYVFGPLVIPLWLHPGTATYFDFWWRSLLRVLAWSVVWAVEFKLFGAVLALASSGNVANAAIAPLVGLALLLVMYKTPKAIPGPTPMQGWEMVSRHVTGPVIHRATTRVVNASRTVVSGSASAAASGAARVGTAVTGAVSARSGAQAGRRNP